MKKTHTGRIVPVAALILTIPLFTTCKNNIGMGGTIDINPPTIKNDSVYPPNNAVIKGAFRLAVKADDDTGVNAVTAVITTANAQNSKINIGNSFLQRPSSKDGYWTLDIDPKGQYPIGDGSYKVEIQATDTAGKVAAITSAFTIDNTPPLLILNRPGTSIAKSEDLENSAPDEFGFDFLLVGQVYDESAVPTLKITAEGNGQKREKTLNNIPQNIRITVDSFGSNTENPFYKPLYNGEENGGSKKYEYGITVTDAAKQYNNPGDGGTGTGNTTNRYYLFDDLYKPVLSTYKIQEVYAMLRGTYNSESGWMRSIAGSDQLQDVKKALQNYQIGGGTKKGSFALNPSRNPRFAIAGEEAAPRPSNPSGAPNFSQLYSGSSLKVKISHNLDGVPLEGADTYRFFLMKWSDFLTYTGSSPYPTEQINGPDTEPIYTGGKLIPINNPSFQREGSNYLFTLPISASLGITYNNNYVLLVRGKDQNGNKLIPDLTKVAGGAYGFSFVENGKAPEVYVTKIKGSVSGHETLGTGADPDPNKKNITERVYLKKDDGMEVTVHIGGGGSGPSLKYELTGTVGGNVTQDDVPAVGNTITIPSSKFDQNNEKTYTLTVWATASTGTSLIQTYHIVYDVKEPEADIITLVNDSVITETNGTDFSVSGTAFDSGIGLADVTVILSKIDGKNPFPDRSLTVTTADGRWETQTMNLSNVADYGEGKYTLTMTAKDKLGLSKTLSRTFYYDKKAPEITEFKVNGEAVTNGRTVYTKTTPVAVTGNVTESYGIDTFTINGDNNGLPSTDADVPTAPFNKQLNLSEGLHSNVAIILKDKAGQSAPDFKFDLVVDTTAPNFETSTSAPADQIQFAGQPASGAAGAAAILTSNNPLKITGLIKDPVSGGTASGIKEVQYAVTASSASEPAFPSSEWKMLNGTHESDGNYRLSGFVQADGEKKVWIKAVDNAGNERVFSHKVKVVPPAVITWKLELENNTPSGTVKYNAGTWYAKGQFKVKIGGTLNSAPPGGSPMNVKIEQGSTTKALTDFFDSWTDPKILPSSSPNTYTVKSGQTEGEYTIKIDDAQGQAKLLTFTIDGTAPTITLDPSVPADNTWVNTKALSVSGTAADVTSGIEKIEASVNGTEKLLGTDASWSGYLTLNEGNNTVQFKVTDKAGNTASTPTPPRTIKVDTGRPTITLTAPANGQALVNSTSTSYQVTVTVSDTGGSGIAKVEYATTVGFASPQSATPSGGSATINLTGINGDTTYYFRAVDNAGNPSDSVRVTIQKDNASPTITFDSPQNSQTVNKKITIKGSASDNKELKSVKIVKGDGTELVGVSASSGADGSKAEFTGTKAYNWQFDLDTNRPEYPNAPLTLKAIATDAAGNTEVKLLTLNVDQDSDRPQIVMTNLTALNAAGTYLTTKTLNFVIIDDDGEIEDGKFEITSVPSAAGTLTKTVSGWQYTFAEDGEKTLKFKVTDKKGGVFETDATDKPRVYAKDTTTTVSDAPVKLKVDTKPPQSETPALQFSNANNYSGLNNLEQNAKFNGGMLYLQIMASDASGIQSVTGKIDNVTSTPVQQNVDGAANGHPEKWRIKLDLGTVTEGVKTLTIELTDKAGANSQFTRGIIVDKTAPTVALTYPDPTDPQAGEITVSGTIVDDGAGVNPDKTKYILGKKASPPTVSTPDASSPADTNGWKPMDTSTKGSWTVKLNLDTVPSTEYGNAVGLYKEIPLYIFTEDEIGNKKVHEKKILFDPDGTKPIVKILSPQNTTPATKLGGTIQIFGTASVPKGGPAAVGEVYIQFSHNGTFANDADGTFGTVNWYNSGNGQLISGTDTNGGADWRISINGDGSFNHATNQNQDVYFRVRAKNKNGLSASTGQWTEKIKIIVDKSAPTIGSPNAVKVDDSSSTAIAGSANAKDYTPNMWVGRNKKLIGSLKDDSGIKAVHITSTGLAGGVNYNLSQAQTAGWIAPVTGGNYELKIPFDLDALSPAAKKAGEFSVTVSITENTTSPALSTQQTFTFRFDTTDPIGDFGTDKYMNIGNFTSSSITDAQLAQKVKDLGATTSSGGGCKILADNHILTVTKVTGDKIEFTASPALTAGSHSYILYKPETLIYKNSSGKWIVNGVANDSGSGVAEVKAWVSVETDPVLHTVIKSPETVINETDTANRITKQLGGTVTWKGLVDFGSVPDGKGKLHYTITDKSGNTYTPPGVDVVVKNKPVEVTKVTLKTKIGGIDVETDKPGATETDPQTVVTGDTTDAQLNQTKTVESKNFAFKSTTNSKIKVEFSGGQGTVKYRLRKSDGTLLQDLTAVTSGSEIDLTPHFGTGSNKINNSNGTPTTIKLELWDEAHGYTQGTDSAWAKVDITTLFDALDSKPPTVVILPFHWNGEGDNSLYQNSRANGHVEIDSSSVSGKVTLRGFAYDNVQLKTLTATLPNASGITVTNTTNNWSISEDTSKNIKFEVEESKYDYLGYYVKWKLEWDSEKTSVGLGKTISVSAHDGTNSSGTSAADSSSPSSSLTRGTNDTAEHADFAAAKPGQFILFTKGEAQHLTRVKSVTGNKIELINAVDTGFVTATLYKDTTNKPSISVNVVPYITGVETSIKTLLGKDFMRTATGAYTVRAKTSASEYETVTVTGFNLQPTTVSGNDSDIRLSKSKTALEGTTKKGTGLTASQVTSGDNSKWNVIIKSAGNGYLTFIVNGVPSINNIDNNAAEYNKEASLIQANADNDRKIELWDFTQLWKNSVAAPDAKNAVYPSMVMKENTPQFAYVNNSKGYGLAKFWNGTDEIGIYENWDLFTFSALALNSDNSRAALFDINVVQSGNGNPGDSGGIMTNFFYDPPTTTWNGTSYYFRNYNVWMDGLYKAGVTAVLDRYQYPCIKMVGNNNLSHVFYSTYDGLDDCIIFRYFKVGTDATLVGNNNSANAHKVHKDTVTPNLYINKNELNQVRADSTDWPVYGDSSYQNKRFDRYGNYSGTTTLPKAFAAGSGNGLYSAAAGVPVMTTGNIVNTARGILVYYSGTSLNYVYATNDANTAWSTPVVLDTNCGGDYVSMVVDKDKHVHIAYQDSFGGDVKYIYIPEYSTPATRKMVKVDSYLTVGGKLTLTVHDNTPYIAYKGVGNVAKVAWYKAHNGVPDTANLADGVNDNDKFTGAWESQIIPTRIVDSDSNRFNIGVGIDGKPVIGYSNNQSGNKGIEYLTRMPDLTD